MSVWSHVMCYDRRGVWRCSLCGRTDRQILHWEGSWPRQGIVGDECVLPLTFPDGTVEQAWYMPELAQACQDWRPWQFGIPF